MQWIVERKKITEDCLQEGRIDLKRTLHRRKLNCFVMYIDYLEQKENAVREEYEKIAKAHLEQHEYEKIEQLHL